MAVTETHGRYRIEQLSPLELFGFHARLVRTFGGAAVQALMLALAALAKKSPAGVEQALDDAAAKLSSVAEGMATARPGAGILDRGPAELLAELQDYSVVLAPLLNAFDGDAMMKLARELLVYQEERSAGGLSVQLIEGNDKTWYEIRSVEELNEKFEDCPIELPQVAWWAIVVNLRPFTAALGTALQKGKETIKGRPQSIPARAS